MKRRRVQQCQWSGDLVIGNRSWVTQVVVVRQKWRNTMLFGHVYTWTLQAWLGLGRENRRTSVHYAFFFSFSVCVLGLRALQAPTRVRIHAVYVHVSGTGGVEKNLHQQPLFLFLWLLHARWCKFFFNAPFSGSFRNNVLGFLKILPSWLSRMRSFA